MTQAASLKPQIPGIRISYALRTGKVPPDYTNSFSLVALFHPAGLIFEYCMRSESAVW
jgi:hypothetical protein